VIFRYRGIAAVRAAAVIVPLCLAAAGCAPELHHYNALTAGEARPEYRSVRDGITCIARAEYRMDHGIATDITVTLENGSAGTLSTDEATVRVASANVGYQYNNKFLPLQSMSIPHGASRDFHLSGRDVDGADDWHKIAGEKLTLTIRGLRLGGRTLPDQDIVFIPENPKLKQ
jgi:hypothetical protein